MFLIRRWNTNHNFYAVRSRLIVLNLTAFFFGS